MSTEKEYIQKLIYESDVALYAAKNTGRNKVVVFNPKMKAYFGAGAHSINEQEDAESAQA